MKQTTPFCEMLRRFACSCLYGEPTKPIRRRMRKIIERYVQVEFEMVGVAARAAKTYLRIRTAKKGVTSVLFCLLAWRADECGRTPVTVALIGVTDHSFLLYFFLCRFQGEDPEFQTDDFTVVVQPFTYKLNFPLKNPNATDFSYMAPDCFHFSQRGYARGK